MRKKLAAISAVIPDDDSANPQANLVHCKDEETVQMIVNILRTQHCIEREWRLPADTLQAYREHVMKHGTAEQKKAIEKR